jgi:hypothetical protein
MKHTRTELRERATAWRKEQEGKAGYILAWLLGIPIPVLVLFWLFRG